MATDNAAELLGVERLEVRDGYARFRMLIRNDMLNMHGTCHGGILFTLADIAFAYACNWHNISAVAQGASIDYVEPVYEGDILEATARARVQKKRTGVYDIEVKNQDDKLVAIFIGKSFTIRKEKS